MCVTPAPASMQASHTQLSIHLDRASPWALIQAQLEFSFLILTMSPLGAHTLVNPILQMEKLRQVACQAHTVRGMQGWAETLIGRLSALDVNGLLGDSANS